MDRPLTRAAEIVGSKAQLARCLGVTPALIWQWETGYRPLPVGRVSAIEEATAGRVRAEELRPDVTWHRDESGAVTGYTIPVAPATPTEKVA